METKKKAAASSTATATSKATATAIATAATYGQMEKLTRTSPRATLSLEWLNHGPGRADDGNNAVKRTDGRTDGRTYSLFIRSIVRPSGAATGTYGRTESKIPFGRHRGGKS